MNEVPAGSPGVEPQGSVLRQPRFRNYLLLRTLSLLGDSAWWFALSWEAARLGGPDALGLVLAVGGIPRFLLTIIGGNLADRLGIRRVMIGSDLIAAALAGLTAVLWWTVGGSIAVLLTVALLFGVIDAFYGPSSAAFTRMIVSETRLAQAISARQTAASLAAMVGTAAGGFVVGSAGFGWVAAFDAATFLLIGVGLSRIRSDEVTTGTTDGPVKDLLSGFRYLWRNVLVRLSLFRALILNGLGMALVNVGLVLQAQDRGWSSAQLAVVDVGLAIGMATTGLVFTHLESPRRAGLLAGWGFVLYSVLQLGLLLIPVYPVVIVLAVLVGAVLVPTSSISDGIVQNAIPAERLGTINGAMITVSLGAIPVGNALFGVAADQLSPSGAIRWFGAAMLATCLVLAGVRPLRTATLKRSDDDAA